MLAEQIGQPGIEPVFVPNLHGESGSFHVASVAGRSFATARAGWSLPVFTSWGRPVLTGFDSLGNETRADTILPTKVREEYMLTAEKPLRAMGNISYRNSFIMLALFWILPIRSLGQTATTPQNTPAPLQSVRNNAAAGASDKKDNSAVVGVWRGELDNLPGATLNVTDEAGSLQGAILF